jgi:hypothetical protein
VSLSFTLKCQQKGKVMQLVDPKYISHYSIEGVITKVSRGTRQQPGQRAQPYCNIEFLMATVDGDGNQTLKTQSIKLPDEYDWDRYAEGMIVRLPVTVSAYGAIGAALSIKVDVAQPEPGTEVHEPVGQEPKRPFYPQREAAE